MGASFDVNGTTYRGRNTTEALNRAYEAGAYGGRNRNARRARDNDIAQLARPRRTATGNRNRRAR